MTQLSNPYQNVGTDGYYLGIYIEPEDAFFIFKRILSRLTNSRSKLVGTFIKFIKDFCETNALNDHDPDNDRIIAEHLAALFKLGLQRSALGLVNINAAARVDGRPDQGLSEGPTDAKSQPDVKARQASERSGKDKRKEKTT